MAKKPSGNRPWHYLEQGEGRPLVLLHGIGMSHKAWAPVMPLLAAHRRVIAFDVAGFGRTSPLPQGETPSIPNLAKALGESLRALGIKEPVDLVGNSMGGHIALEAALLGLARTVTAISPGGLWRREAPLHVKPFLALMRQGVLTLPELSQKLVSFLPGRIALLSVAMTAKSWRIPAEAAVGAIQDLMDARAFEQTLDAAGPFVGGHEITVPVTVAFGRRDWLLTKGAQRRDELPEQTRWVTPVWGHVPMWEDPQGVTDLILESAQ